jgi:hypothetical protein
MEAMYSSEKSADFHRLNDVISQKIEFFLTTAVRTPESTVRELPSSTVFDLMKLKITRKTASVVYWSEFLATDPEVPGSIPGTTRFSEK